MRAMSLPTMSTSQSTLEQRIAAVRQLPDLPSHLRDEADIAADMLRREQERHAMVLRTLEECFNEGAWSKVISHWTPAEVQAAIEAGKGQA